jgi:hypothetical protein
LIFHAARSSELTIDALKSSTHSQITPCRSWIPKTFAGRDIAGSSWRDGREYHARICATKRGSACASARVSSAHAASSHSSSVGKRAPLASQYARAENQLTFTTGCVG